MSHRTSRTSTLAAALTIAFVAAGCGEDTTGTAQAGVSAEITDQASGTASVAMASLLPLQSAGYSGSFDGDARVEVSTDGETWTELDESSQVSVDLRSSGDATSVHTGTSVPAGTYTRVRLVLSGAEANLASGSTIGGTTLTSAVTLTIGGSGEIVIEKELQQSLELDADSDATLAFDINSEAWVTEENVSATAVESAEIRSATAVAVDTG